MFYRTKYCFFLFSQLFDRFILYLVIKYTVGQFLGQKTMTHNMSGHDAMVDLQQASVFEEPFYIVLLDCTDQNTIIHMWKLTIASTDTEGLLSGSQMYVPDSNLVQDENESSRKNSVESLHLKPSKVSPHINLTVTREVKQILPLPDGVEIVHATPAAGKCMNYRELTFWIFT